MALLAGAAPAVAQKPSASSTDAEKGFTEVESFQSTLNSQEKLFKLDSTVGWDFSKHFGVFAGVPVYFVEIPSSTTMTGTTTTTTPSSSHNGIGNAYLGLAFRAPNPMLEYTSAITSVFPLSHRSGGGWMFEYKKEGGLPSVVIASSGAEQLANVHADVEGEPASTLTTTVASAPRTPYPVSRSWDDNHDA